MDITMTEIVSMIDETDMNIKEYTESTIDLIDRMDQMELLRSAYFTEAKQDKEDEAIIAQQKTLFEKIKDSIKKIFDKLIHLIPNIIKRAKSSSRMSRVEKLGDKLNKMSKLGVDLGKLKVSIPNIQVYDSFIIQMIEYYIISFNTNMIDRFLLVKGNVRKIDALIDNINKMTSALSSGDATKNNINDILKEVYKKNKLMSTAYRAVPGSSEVSDTYRKSNRLTDNEVNVAVKNRKLSNKTDSANTNTLAKRNTYRYESVEDNYMEDSYQDTVTKWRSEFEENKRKNQEKYNNDVKQYNKEYTQFAAGVKKRAAAMGSVFTASFVITFAIIGATIASGLKRFFSNAPSKIKTEEITVSALYRRALDMKLDVMENRITRTINEAESIFLKGMTLEEFAKSGDKDKKLVLIAQKMSELLNAYTKFEVAELNYYYRILLEVDSKLSVKNIKALNGAPIVTKEATDTEDTTINMEDFMDLESFMSIE